MSKKFFRTVGKIAGAVTAVAAVATGIGAALGGTMMLTVFGSSIAASAIAGAAGLIATGASLLAKPKSPKISQTTQDRLNVSLDPLTPRKTVFGRTAMATDLRDQEYTGANKEFLHRFVGVACHKVNSIQEVWFDDQLAWSLAGGVAAKYAGYLTVTPILEGTPANAINVSARLGSSRRFTGCAYVYLRFKLTGNSKKTESPFASQVPTRMTIIGEGMPCYDPRQDSTVPGGSGAHRADDQTTWTYGEHARNNACQYATWRLGWRIQNPQSGTWKLSVGEGLPPERFDWPSFIEAANLCDEAVALAAGGTEPRYRSDGLFDESDPNVRDALTASMNADADDQDGLIRLTVFHNDLATIDADFTEADVEDDYTWQQTQPLHESYNVVRGTYISTDPKALYQPAPSADAKVPSRDGIDRVHPASFGNVQSKGQSERLKKQRLQRELYGGTFKGNFLASGWKVQKNSVVRFNFAPEGFVNKLFRVAEFENARPDGRVPMTLVEENAQIYAWDAEESPDVELAEPTEYAPGDTPVAQFLGTIEEGATAGATIGVDVKIDGGSVPPAGAVLNDGVALVPIGELLSLQYEPGDGGEPVVLSQVTPPDFGAAKAAAVSQAADALERLAAAVVQLQQEAGRTRAVMRDAGIAIDPETGQVHLHAFDRSEERLNTVDVRLNAAESSILLRATTTYVDNAIATAVLDPSQVPVFDTLAARITTAEADIDGLQGTVSLLATNVAVDALTARVTTAETDIDALEGAISSKVENTDFSALETRVDSAESQLSAMEGASITDTVRAARMLVNAADDQDAQTLAGLLAADRAKRSQVAAVAEARQELTAKIVDDVSAEASQRLALATRVANAEASLVTESTVRASADSAIASQVTSLSTTVAGHTASITAFAGSIDGLQAKAGLRLDVGGRITGWALNSDGGEGSFAVVADEFAIVDPDGGAAMTWENGILWNKGATQSIILGQAFGASADLMFWIGPNPASPAAATKADGLFWVDASGAMFYGGATANSDYVQKAVGPLTFADTNVWHQVGSLLTVFPLGSSTEVKLTATPNGQAFGGNAFSYEIKWQYSADQSTWSDVAGASIGGGAVGAGATNSVGNQAAGTKTGLTTGLAAYFRLVARRTVANGSGINNTVGAQAEAQAL